MGEGIRPPKRSNVLSPIDITSEEEVPMASPLAQRTAAATKPVFGASPRNGGSTLYDSYELVAMTNQLNKVMVQARLNNPSPTLMTCLGSPFYRQRLNRISHDDTKRTSRRVPCPRLLHDRKSNTTGLMGAGCFVSRLWKKVKQGLLRNKH